MSGDGLGTRHLPVVLTPCRIHGKAIFVISYDSDSPFVPTVLSWLTLAQCLLMLDAAR